MDICSLPLEDKKTGKQLVAQLWDTQGEYVCLGAFINSAILQVKSGSIHSQP